MSATSSQKLPKLAQVADSSSGQNSVRSAAVDLGEEGTLGPVPPPLPKNPAVRAELRQRLENGLASAKAGIGEDWETVHARVRARLNLPPL